MANTYKDGEIEGIQKAVDEAIEKIVEASKDLDTAITSINDFSDPDFPNWLKEKFHSDKLGYPILEKWDLLQMSEENGYGIMLFDFVRLYNNYTLSKR